MSELPADILAEIFIRVPAEPLFRTRGVCKAWRNVIDDPTFCKLHVRHYRGRVDDDQLIVCGSYKLSLESLENCIEEDPTKSRTCIKAKHMPAFEDRPSFKSKSVISSSYFGVSSDGLDLLTDNLTRLALYNRLTHEFLELPCPIKSPWCAGLGYDSATDDYKVVTLSEVSYKGERSCRTMVYSLNSDAWRTVETPRYHLPHYDHLVSFNGKMYWLANKQIEESLVVLDLSTETYGLLPLPPMQPQARLLGRSWQFKAMGGCLFLSYFSKTASLDGWILNCCGADKSSWTKLFTFSDFVRDGIHVTDLYLVPQAYLKSKGLVLIRMGRDEYIWLDTTKKTSKRIKIEGLMEKHFVSRSCFQPSIVRLNGSGRGDRFQIIPTKQRNSDLELGLIRY